eukprot:TRINITY_DN2746_c0_g1_i5.p1 TRINITY_DN2746_c0_g1~~TRINITY_DN2746_c0_g1_i5.p1  ORF type:complete len:502 (+),score=96.62 TRINITY_DN2746_c0_g1_i5:26-1531(+)
MKKLLFLCSFILFVYSYPPDYERASALCEFSPLLDSDPQVAEVLRFRTLKDGTVNINFESNPPAGEYSFHVHEYGDLKDIWLGANTGAHLKGNPAWNKSCPGEQESMIGNLFGGSDFKHMESVKIQLHPDRPEFNIIGRSIVLHKNYNASGCKDGPKISQCVVGLSKDMGAARSYYGPGQTFIGTCFFTPNELKNALYYGHVDIKADNKIRGTLNFAQEDLDTDVTLKVFTHGEFDYDKDDIVLFEKDLEVKKGILDIDITITSDHSNIIGHTIAIVKKKNGTHDETLTDCVVGLAIQKTAESIKIPPCFDFDEFKDCCGNATVTDETNKTCLVMGKISAYPNINIIDEEGGDPITAEYLDQALTNYTQQITLAGGIKRCLVPDSCQALLNPPETSASSSSAETSSSASSSSASESTDASTASVAPISTNTTVSSTLTESNTDSPSPIGDDVEPMSKTVSPALVIGLTILFVVVISAIVILIIKRRRAKVPQRRMFGEFKL